MTETTVAFGNDPDLPSFPDYSILEKIRDDGLSVTYRAIWRPRLRQFALRVARNGSDGVVSEAFAKEASLLARMRHPNVMSVSALLSHQGRVAQVLEYAAGGTLPEECRRGPLSSREAATLCERLALALTFVHSQGITHCNLKPSSIFLMEPFISDVASNKNVIDHDFARRSLKIGRFELAIDDQQPGSYEEGMMVGNPAYMAPEQLSGPWLDVGPACDIYGLGGILYNLLTGRRPFHTDSIHELLSQKMNHEPELIRKFVPDVNERLEFICQKCLRKQPEKRYKNVLELAEDLGDCASMLASEG